MGFSASNGNLPDNSTITLTAGGRLQALGIIPIGGIIAWDKTFTNTPTLPSNYKECDGSVISEPLSVYNGQTVRNLNGVQRMIRGASTSGTTGGADTMTLTTAELPAHTHTVAIDTDGLGAGTASRGGFSQETTYNTSSAGSGTAFSLLSAYMQMVYVQRIY